ncbi:TetR/AcrR family transcriptional regulator [Streptomyces lunaelactis]|uniref:TetR/AcrR family transcriptional regulator n=1 Tax=Streptomyces lunaelactis TaxID=1535768 RepID=A0A2R4SY04_9ACTN|nr:TetR/AcrR family transcriptional regulator [Streptomyces lunaelactis]AVZ71738.1 TetR/AcrR family transcriptional regulator [Streptomyces lunaelactis]NUK83057.1 TetR/AcrR family transcriptional regulator [Streptomyces lunaelactis]NUL02515.1 TetR/AcrR family transcriptional regulator [Streptomyces lunaelactis]
MARVSQEHLDARRRQILDGATRCFARNGFHATSMQDILREAGLSAGAVYRYFRSKEELIAAIADEAFATIRGAFEDAARTAPPPTPDVLLGRVMRTMLEEHVPGGDRQAFARLIVQVWTETLRNELLATTLDEGYTGMRQVWAKLVDAYRDNGLMGADVPADHVARTLIATAQGFIAQQALFGDVQVEVLENGLRGLMSMRETKIS